MSENNEIKDMKLNDELLDEVSGGVGAASVGVRDVGPYWVRTTARSGLKCRLAPNGKVMTFKTACYDEAGLIGEGTHMRAIVDLVRFEAKAEAKKAK